MRHNKIIAAVLFCLAFAAAGFTIDWDWTKRSRSKRPKGYQRVTSVAAVRGVEEPGDIDPEARDMEGVAWMEGRKIAPERTIAFVVDGKLKIRDANSVPQGDKKPDFSQMASAIGGLAGQSKMAEAVRQISPEEEAEIGRNVAANVIAQFGLLKKEPLTEYVNLIGQNVARSSPRNEVVWRFAILDTKIVNAFAAPGGYIFITKGMLECLKNEAELACVLGHEIVHISDRHVVKEIQRSKILQAAIPDYIHASAKKAEWMNQVSQLAVEMMWKGLSREDEFRSDSQGAALAYNTGYDPHAFAEVLGALKEKSRAASQKKELKFLLSTHPKPEDRLNAFQTNTTSLPAGGEKLESRFKENIPKI